MSLQVSALQNLPEVTVRFYRNGDFDHAYRVIREIGTPQLDPFAGYHIHRMSMPYAPLVGQAADDLLDSLPQVSFDLTVDDDPFAKQDTSSSLPH